MADKDSDHAGRKPGNGRATRSFAPLHVALLAGTVLSTAAILLFREDVRKLEALGYAGIFLFSLISNATLFVPFPGAMFAAAMGAVYSPLCVALAAGAGAALGEYTGYAAGKAGSGLLGGGRLADRIARMVGRYGRLTVFALAFVPNPVFDMAGIAAGALGMRARDFLLWCWLGKTLKMAAFAFMGRLVLGG